MEDEGLDSLGILVQYVHSNAGSEAVKKGE
jgi:hypothetical protein